MSAPVYHYTDTARLPWILQAGELQPGRNTLGRRPNPDLLWATTMPIPDGTAAAYSHGSLDALRQGQTRTVRFTLRAEDFASWPDAVAGYPAWTQAEIRALEKSASSGSSPRSWRCRVEPLPRAAWLAVETRGFKDRDWTTFDPNAELFDLSVEGGPCLGLLVNGLVYFSGKIPQPSGVAAYHPFVGKQRGAA